MSWTGTIDKEGKTFRSGGTSARPIVKWARPRDSASGPLEGLLVTYTKGGTYWSGRGQQSYYRAHYTIHIITGYKETKHGTQVEYIRAIDLDCSAKHALESFLK